MAIQMTYKVIEDTLRIDATSFLYITSSKCVCRIINPSQVHFIESWDWFCIQADEQLFLSSCNYQDD